MVTLDKAIAFAVRFHEKQKDKGGNSYIRHVLRVMERMSAEDEMIVAVLHDVLEDTDAQIEDLKDLGCTEGQIMSIQALTKQQGEPEDKYLARIKKSTVARKVKIADIEDNMAIWRLKNRGNMDMDDLARLNKYGRMWEALTGN